MKGKDVFKIELAKPVCIEGISEDALRELVSQLTVVVGNKDFGGLVLSSGGTQVRFVFGPDGNFQGVTAKVGGKDITLIEGAGSNSLGIFSGSISNTNPGAGWEPDVALTTKYFSQPADPAQWEIFVARRVTVINTI